MASKPTSLKTNGHARRNHTSWIESFVELSEPLESPIVFRRWAAIGTIAAVLEQKTWIQTTGALFPNLYIWLIGHPAIGKSRALTLAGQFLRELPNFNIAPTSVTGAALVDYIVDNPVNWVTLQSSITYHSVTLLVDELSAFSSDYSNDMIGILTTMYDVVVPYGQKRRGKDIDKFIERPQLNIMAGATPSNLIKYIPEYAWDQGFTSRIILVFSDEKIMVEDIFDKKITEPPKSMVHDLTVIRSLYGEFIIHDSYRTPFNAWRKAGCAPIPTHPRLLHYSGRRWAHILKLSMVSCVDRGDDLIITGADFVRAKQWLFEAESMMGAIFSEGFVAPDFKLQEELIHFIKNADKGKGIPGDRIVREARRLMPVYAVNKTIEALEQSNVIRAIGFTEKTGMKLYKFNGDS